MIRHHFPTTYKTIRHSIYVDCLIEPTSLESLCKSLGHPQITILKHLEELRFEGKLYCMPDGRWAPVPDQIGREFKGICRRVGRIWRVGSKVSTIFVDIDKETREEAIKEFLEKYKDTIGKGLKRADFK